MKKTAFLIFALISAIANVNADDWVTIIPAPWTQYAPENYYISGRTFRNPDYNTGKNPYTGNVTIPPYVIERKSDDGYGGIMMITNIGGGVHPGWMATVSRRAGYSEYGWSAPPGMNTNYYGTFYRANIDTLRLPHTINKIGDLAFEEAQVKVLICAAQTPPDFNGNGLPSTCELIVPTGSVEAYKQNEGWKKLSIIKEGAERYMPEQFVKVDKAWYLLSDIGTAMLLNSDDADTLKIPDKVEFVGQDYPVTTLGTASVNRYNVKVLIIGANVEKFEASNIQDSYFTTNFSTAANWVKLSTIEVSEDNPFYSSLEGALYSKDGTSLIYFPRIGETSGYTIPEGVTVIKDLAFPKYSYYNYYNDHSISVVIPPSVRLIEAQNTEKILSLKMTSPTPPSMVNEGFKGVIYVPEGCLYNYIDVYPYNVLNVKESTDTAPNIVPLYKNHYYMADWHLDGDYYDLRVFYDDGDDEEIVIPAKIIYGLMSGPVKIVGKERFSGFYYVNSTNKIVRSLVVPEGVEEICFNTSAFSTVRSVSLPKSLRIIGRNCFQYFKYLQKIVIPANLEVLERWAFEDCNSLLDVYMESATPIDIDNGSSNYFWYLGVPEEATLHVPVGSKTAYENHPVWSGFAKIVEDMPEDIASVATLKYRNKVSLVYNILGQKISNQTESFENLSRGIYIVNGKKVVIQ